MVFRVVLWPVVGNIRNILALRLNKGLNMIRFLLGVSLTESQNFLLFRPRQRQS
jgi:hypothetical protein